MLPTSLAISMVTWGLTKARGGIEPRTKCFTLMEDLFTMCSNTGELFITVLAEMHVGTLACYPQKSVSMCLLLTKEHHRQIRLSECVSVTFIETESVTFFAPDTGQGQRNLVQIHLRPNQRFPLHWLLKYDTMEGMLQKWHTEINDSLSNLGPRVRH